MSYVRTTPVGYRERVSWDLADDFTASVITGGGRVTLWETDLIRTVLAGGPGDVAVRWDSPAGRLFRRHFAEQLARLDAPLITRA